MIDVKVDIDLGPLNRAIATALRFSSRAPEKVIDSMAYHVVKATIANTPFTTVARIDTELAVLVAVKTRPNGKQYSARSSKNVTLVGGKNVSYRGRDVPLAVLIIQAQARAGSNYNRRTNQRWALKASPFRGVSRQAGAMAMREAVSRMIKSRRSSIKFLIAGWVDVKRLLLRRVYGGAPEADAGPAEGFGRVTRMHSGDSYSLTIANVIGTVPGAAGGNAANYNQALRRHGTPALQAAIDQEALRMMQHYWGRMVREDLEPRWNAIR